MEDKWIRIFDVPEVSTHKKGFTIYKIISMLYPERCPDAVTKVTVWKRYNDIKKLHQQMKSLHHSLRLKDRFPMLPNSSFFNRFNEEIIQNRRCLILHFLEYVSEHSQLFTSDTFVKFFETSHTPNHGGTIGAIRAELNLPTEPEYLSFASPDSDDEQTVSTDTDSVSTFSSLSPSLKMETVSTESDDSQYLIEASKHLLAATQFESEQRYAEAFDYYKTAIGVLIMHGKNDQDEARRRLVKFKTEKYLLRAEKIHNIYLQNDVYLYESKQIGVSPLPIQPVSELHKYKVLRIIHSGMLVLHSESQKLFYVKVIQKSFNFSDSEMILPVDVPNMTRLHSFHNCENAVFLILEYDGESNFWQYLQDKANIDMDMENEIDNIYDEDDETSFVDLVTDFNTNRVKSDFLSSKEREEFKKLETQPRDGPSKGSNNSKVDNTNSKSVHNDNEHTNLDSHEIVSKSQNLLDTVDKTLCGIRKTVDHFSRDTNFKVVSYIEFKNVVRWAAQLLLTIEKLHSLEVISCDIQTKKLLINERGDLILTYKFHVNDRTIQRDVPNLAPEVYKVEGLTKAVDWWSYGTVLYEMLTGIPISTSHPEGILSYTTVKLPRNMTVEAKSLITQLLQHNPKTRLGCGKNGANEVKSHPFFNGLDWDSI